MEKKIYLDKVKNHMNNPDLDNTFVDVGFSGSEHKEELFRIIKELFKIARQSEASNNVPEINAEFCISWFYDYLCTAFKKGWKKEKILNELKMCEFVYSEENSSKRYYDYINYRIEDLDFIED